MERDAAQVLRVARGVLSAVGGLEGLCDASGSSARTERPEALLLGGIEGLKDAEGLVISTSANQLERAVDVLRCCGEDEE